VRALRLTGWRREPELVDIPIPTAGPGQVVIRVGGAGACHSDLHVMHEFDEGALPWQVPFTLGHETAGWVHEVGPGVTSVSVGTAVAVFGAWGCGRCARCRLGMDGLCEDQANAPVVGGGGGLGLDGGMAEYMLIPDERFLLPLPHGLDPTTAAPLTDAALTPYHAVNRSLAKLVPDSWTLVIGVGGLGHMAIQILRAMTSTRIIAVDPRPEALEHARELGVDFAFSSGADASENVRDATSGLGADVVLDLVGTESSLALAMASARPLGDVNIVGVAGGVYPLSWFSVPHEVDIRANYWGTRDELAQVLLLASRGLITPEITTYALEDGVRAYRDLAEGRVHGRAVIVP
jgi:alcohol dehydrogenase, propanol-preferring